MDTTACGMLRHQFGGGRSFLTYCYFDSWEQFAEINDSNNPVAGDGPRQLYGDHTDKLAAVVVRNLTKQTPYVLEAKYSFGPYLTDNERRANAKKLFDAYDRAFGGVQHGLNTSGGQSLHGIFTAAMTTMLIFANKVAAISAIHEKELADTKLDILDHSDHLMTRVASVSDLISLTRGVSKPLFFFTYQAQTKLARS